MINYLRNNFSFKSANRLLGALFIIDLIFIIIHIITCFLYFIGRIENFGDYNFLVLTQDESFAEIFQYLKYISVIIMIGYLMNVEKAYAYISWVLLFIFFLLDDSLSLHESMGEVLVDEFNFKPMFGLRAVDFGELTFVAIVGIAILLSFVLAYFKGNSIFKMRTIDLFILLGFMIFFGVGFDMLHEILGENLKVGFVIGLIEDGGEMVVMTLIVWYVYQLIKSDKKVKSYLFEILIPKQVKI